MTDADRVRRHAEKKIKILKELGVDITEVDKKRLATASQFDEEERHSYALILNTGMFL